MRTSLAAVIVAALVADTARAIRPRDHLLMTRGSSVGDEHKSDAAPESQSTHEQQWRNPSGTYRGQVSMRSLCPVDSEFLGRYCIADGQSRLFKDLCFRDNKPSKSHPPQPPHAARLLNRGIGSSSARVSDAIDINPNAPMDKGKSPTDQNEEELPRLQFPTVYGACPDFHLCLQDQNPEGARASIDCVSLHALRLDNLKGDLQYGYRVLGRPETDDELATRGVVVHVLRDLGAGTVSAALGTCTRIPPILKMRGLTLTVMPLQYPGDPGYPFQLAGRPLSADFFEGAELRDGPPRARVCSLWEVVDGADWLLNELDKDIRQALYRTGNFLSAGLLGYAWSQGRPSARQRPADRNGVRDRGGDRLNLGTPTQCRPDRIVELRRDDEIRFTVTVDELPAAAESGTLTQILVYLFRGHDSDVGPKDKSE